MFFESKIQVLVLILIVFSIDVIPFVLAEEEDEEEMSDNILSKYSSENLTLVTNSESEQWENSFENEIDSIWGHDIEIKSLNDGNDLYFLISWEDDTKSVDNPDGVVFFLETKKIVKPMILKEEHDEEEYEIHVLPEIQVTVNEEIWKWESDGTEDDNILVNAEWKNNRWNVALGKKMITDKLGEIKMGETTDAFLKVAVWDGDQNQTFVNIEEEDIPELRLLVLPEINSNPKDIYVWSAILAVGTGSFLIAEIRKHQRMEA